MGGDTQTMTTWVTFLAGTLGLLTLLVGAFLVVRSGQAATWKASAEAHKANSEAERARGDRLEQELAELRRRVDAQDAEIRALRTLHDHTERLASIDASIAAVSDKLSMMIERQSR